MSNKNFDNDDVSMYYPDGDSAHMADDDISTKKYCKSVKQKLRTNKRYGTISKKHWIIISVVFIAYTIALLTASWVLFYRPSQNVEDTLPFDDTPSFTNVNEEDDPKLSDDNNNNPGVNSDTYTPKEGVYNILLVGHDREAHLADVTMIINCDTVNNTISVMQIPRDTYVDLKLTTNKINESFAKYYGQAWSSNRDTAELVSLTSYERMLEKSLCININYTVLLNLNGFRNIVDAIGGVTLYVPTDMEYDDPEQDLYIYLKQGMRTLNGSEAEQFIRFRSDYVQADLGRINAQKIFLTAMFNQVKSVIKNLDIPAMTSLATEISENIYTEMTVNDMMYFAKYLVKVNLEDINMMTIPGNMAGNHYVANREATLNVINDYFNIYNKKITDSIFDPNRLFCNLSSTESCNVYFGDPKSVLDGIYNADDIDKDSIDIPVLNH